MKTLLEITVCLCGYVVDLSQLAKQVTINSDTTFFVNQIRSDICCVLLYSILFKFKLAYIFL